MKELKIEDLKNLFMVMTTPWCVYILGAGASFGLAPLTSQMSADYKKEHPRVWFVNGRESIEHDEMFKRIIGHINNDNKDIFLKNMSKVELPLLFQRRLVISPKKCICPQYQIFNIIALPRILFNFNLDGLASYYCGNLPWGLNAHGTIDRKSVENTEKYKNNLIKAAEFNIGPRDNLNKVLPGQEPKYITNKACYKKVQEIFPNIRYVVIIGYSFARFEGKYDDIESLLFFIDLLKRYPKPVFIVDPYPTEITELFQNETKSYSVFPIPAFWDKLSSAIFKIGIRNNCLDLNRLGKKLNEIIDLYYKYIYEKRNIFNCFHTNN